MDALEVSNEDDSMEEGGETLDDEVRKLLNVYSDSDFKCGGVWK